MLRMVQSNWEHVHHSACATSGYDQIQFFSLYSNFNARQTKLNMGTLNNKNVLVQGLPQKQNGQRDMNSEQYTKVKEDGELAKLQ